MVKNDIAKIIYATDMGEHTRPAFYRALSLARVYSAELVILHIVETLDPARIVAAGLHYPIVNLDTSNQPNFDEIKVRVENRLQSMLSNEAELLEDKRLKPRCIVLEGDPAKTIMATATAENADLIVLGSHTYSTLERLLLGSVANEVVNCSKTPVLLVPIKAG